MKMEYHNSVLLRDSIDALAIKEDGVYVDITFGGGGHSREILSRLGEKGKLVAVSYTHLTLPTIYSV